MRPNQLLSLALVGEGVLVVLVISWHTWQGEAPVMGSVPLGLAVGAFSAVVLAAVNLYLLCHAPDMPGVRGIRQAYRKDLKPLFSTVRASDVFVIGVIAGVGEEMFFRGVLQSELGLAPASAIFGALHIGGRTMVEFGVWVALMGAMLGALAIWTDGLLAPIVAHAAYDVGALAYIRWGTDCVAVASVVGKGSTTDNRPA